MARKNSCILVAYTLLYASMISVASCHHFTLPAFATNYVFTFLVTAHGAPKESLYGWCKTKHKPPVKAQSGYGDYCKACFRLNFPKKHSAKMQSRKKNMRSAMLRQSSDKEFANHVGRRAVVATAVVTGSIKTQMQRNAHDAA